ncbi:MAG TPA: hypothetical protein VK907_05930, partial [Phnomibacter sp.]|nr:hypothetical protein [Phnomibacter sp.]
MKTMLTKIAAAIFICGLITIPATNHAQTLKDMMKGKSGQDTTKKSSGGLMNQVSKAIGGGGNLSAAEVAEGLKAALDQGVAKGTDQ